MPYIDILLFAIIAFVLVTRLGKILGDNSSDGDRANVKQTWAKTFEKRKNQKAKPDSAQKNFAPKMPLKIRKSQQEKPSPSTQSIVDQDIMPSPVASGLRDIAHADPNFDADAFVNGSKRAFEMVLTAFVAGDKETLRNLLDSKLYTTFTSVIDIRVAEGHTAKNDLVAIDNVTPIKVTLDDTTAIIELQFKSQQINVTYDDNEQVVDGHPKAIDTITDIWTFERDVTAKAPNWILTHTRTVD